MQALIETNEISKEQKASLGFEIAKNKLTEADSIVGRGQLKAVAVWLLVQEPLYTPLRWADEKEGTDMIVEDLQRVKKDIKILFGLLGDVGNLPAWLSKFRKVHSAFVVSDQSGQYWECRCPKTFNRNLSIKEVHLGVHLKNKDKPELPILQQFREACAKADNKPLSLSDPLPVPKRYPTESSPSIPLQTPGMSDLVEVSPGIWIRKGAPIPSEWSKLVELQQKSVEELKKKTELLQFTQEIDKLRPKRKAQSDWFVEENNKKCKYSTFNDGHRHVYQKADSLDRVAWVHCQMPFCGSLFPPEAMCHREIMGKKYQCCCYCANL